MAGSSRHIEGRTALVTGAGRGIGRAIAEGLARGGGRVAVCDVDEVAAHGAAEALGRLGQARAYALDVTDAAAFADVVRRVQADLGPVDILVNNAGIMSLGPFVAQPLGADQRQIEVNLFGVVHGMRAVLPGMVARGRGHVVNVASVAGRVGVPHAAVYAATKHAVIGLTEAVRMEHQGTGVQFTYVCPALVDTDLISGTGRPRFPPPLRPEQVAVAALDALRTGRVDVYVPRFTRISVLLPALLPRAIYERVGRAFGIADMFTRVDPDARGAYDARISKRGDRDR